jgi:hypothetical protein
MTEIHDPRTDADLLRIVRAGYMTDGGTNQQQVYDEAMEALRQRGAPYSDIEGTFTSDLRPYMESPEPSEQNTESEG